MRWTVAALLVLALTVSTASAQSAPLPRFYGVLNGYLDACSWYPVKGMSMKPTLKDGDLVCAARFNFQVLTYGDMVLYRTSGVCKTIYGDKLILHRVVRIERDADGTRMLKVMGDAETALDLCEVREKDYVGMVTGVMRPGVVLPPPAPPVPANRTP